MLFSARCAIAAETVAYAEMLGFGKEELEDLLEFGLTPSLYGDDFPQILGTVRLNFKDLKYAQEIAFDHQICLPVTAAVYQAFLHTVIHGGGNCDQNAIIKYWRDINKKDGDVL
jgi:3-hydroxyisobutyrate dehydrogenase-like beta-hydroxyacid dehydrogenase